MYHVKFRTIYIDLDILGILKRKFPENFLKISGRYIKTLVSTYYKQKYHVNQKKNIENYFGWLIMNHYNDHREVFDWMADTFTKKGNSIMHCVTCLQETKRTFIGCEHALCRDCIALNFVKNNGKDRTLSCEMCDFLKKELAEINDDDNDDD
jgi:hypothetical protein